MSESEKNIDERSDTRSKFWKFWVVMVAVNIGYFFVIMRLFAIQVIKGDEYREKAKKQHESRVEISAKRGNIYDRNGKLLATTIQSLSVAVDPQLLDDVSDFCDSLAKALNQPASKFKQKIENAKGNFVWIARGITYSPYLTRLKTQKQKGVIIIEEPKRIFPFGSVGAQVVGFTNIDNKGIEGIERGYDTLLKGNSGYMIMYRDGLGHLRPSPDLPLIPAIDGRSIQLTVDIELQRIIEHELSRGIDAAKASAGTVIAIKPQTGEIIAMASFPTFDPGNRNAPPEAKRNRGITDVFEPGSTFKLITACAGIEENVVTEEEIMDGHNGSFQFLSFTIKDVHAMGRVPFREAIHQSSNIILSEVATRIGEDRFYKYIRNFGFGGYLGIDIPGEISGKVPKPAQFTPGTIRFLGHGYALNSTPLQVVNAYATVANEGQMMKPYLVKGTYNVNEQFVEHKPEKIRRVISEKTAKRITELFVGVVDSGSGKKAIIKGLRIAGKTGTAQQIVNGQYSKQDYFASFVGYYPADNPQIAIIVVVDRPRVSIYGGASAAPIFQNIASRIISINPEYSLDKKSKIDSIRKLDNDTIIVPSIAGLYLKDAKVMLSQYGLRLNTNSNSGIVFNQYPKSGSKVIVGSNVNVTLMSEHKSTNSSNISQNIKHDVTGLTIRRALALLQKSGVRTKVIGRGKVVSQSWSGDKTQLTCTLSCSNSPSSSTLTVQQKIAVQPLQQNR
ncbi:MAG: penicillin-binding transpeptidase domain-containing protein [Candidatus Kapabacteria bacterium]|nr:penicillin-binding transpeptidase domain-containing protein [Candidatus Kapabacteria bacterium]